MKLPSSTADRVVFDLHGGKTMVCKPLRPGVAALARYLCVNVMGGWHVEFAGTLAELLVAGLACPEMFDGSFTVRKTGRTDNGDYYTVTRASRRSDTWRLGLTLSAALRVDLEARYETPPSDKDPVWLAKERPVWIQAASIVKAALSKAEHSRNQENDHG